MALVLLPLSYQVEVKVWINFFEFANVLMPLHFLRLAVLLSTIATVVIVQVLYTCVININVLTNDWDRLGIFLFNLTFTTEVPVGLVPLSALCVSLPSVNITSTTSERI